MALEGMKFSPAYKVGAKAILRGLAKRLQAQGKLTAPVAAAINEEGAQCDADCCDVADFEVNGVGSVEGFQSAAAAASVTFTFTDATKVHRLGRLIAATDDVVSGDLYLEIVQVKHGNTILFEPNPSGKGIGVAAFKRDATNPQAFWPEGYELGKNEVLTITCTNRHGLTAVISRLDIAPIAR